MTPVKALVEAVGTPVVGTALDNVAIVIRLLGGNGNGRKWEPVMHSLHHLYQVIAQI
jgi:hypothetical protein